MFITLLKNSNGKLHTVLLYENTVQRCLIITYPSARCEHTISSVFVFISSDDTMKVSCSILVSCPRHRCVQDTTHFAYAALLLIVAWRAGTGCWCSNTLCSMTHHSGEEEGGRRGRGGGGGSGGQRGGSGG